MGSRGNSKLFRCGTAERVNLDTGEVTPIEGGGLMMLPGSPGTCEWCHVKHDPAQPHNQQSLPYQIKFKTIHGRAPTWSDAMSHCAPEVQEFWREALREQMTENGMPIPEDLQ